MDGIQREVTMSTKDSDKISWVSKKRNGEIDFLKFLFALVIVIFHSRRFAGEHQVLFLRGSLCVEFFFLVSGFFMAKGLERQSKITQYNVADDTVVFVKKKLTGIYTYYIVGFVIAFVLRWIANGYSIHKALLVLFGSVPEVLLLQMTGIWNSNINGPTWYISAMLIAMVIVYPFARKWWRFTLKVTAPLVSLFILGWLLNNYSSISGVLIWTGLAYKSMFRAVAEILLGFVCFGICKQLEKIKISKFIQIVISFIQVSVLCIVFYYMNFPLENKKYEVIILALMAVILIIAASGKSFISFIFNNKSCIFLGKFSLAIYLAHFNVVVLIDKWIPNISYYKAICCVLVIASMIAVLILLTGDYITKHVAHIFAPSIPNKKDKVIKHEQ